VTRYKHKMSASIPAAKRDAINAELDRTLGCGPDTFWVPMTNAGGRVIRYGTQWKMTAEDKAVLQSIMGAPGNQGDSKENEHVNEHAKRHGLSRQRNARVR